MRKISLLMAAISALMISCSAPYYPEYVPVISLGASTNNLICEKEEGIASLSVLSNTDYTATLVSGNDWVRFAEEDPAVRNGHGNDVLEFVINANNHDKRVAELVLAVGDTRRVSRLSRRVASMITSIFTRMIRPISLLLWITPVCRLVLKVAISNCDCTLLASISSSRFLLITILQLAVHRSRTRLSTSL